MTLVKPTPARSRISSTTAGLQILIPAKRNAFLLLFLAAWLVGWGFGEVTVLKQLMSPEKEGEGVDLFLIAWLVMWTIGGAFAVVVWFWAVAGWERITVSPSRLVIKREVFGIGPVKEYDREYVKNLRVAAFTYNPFDFQAGLRFWGLGGGPIAFDYGAATVRFGGPIDEAEATQILQRITT